MNTKTFNDLQLQNNLIEMKIGRKRFPGRNWHYNTNLRSTRGEEQSYIKQPEIDFSHQWNKPSLTQGQMKSKPELDSLRQELKDKERQINQLKKQISLHKPRFERLTKLNKTQMSNAAKSYKELISPILNYSSKDIKMPNLKNSSQQPDSAYLNLPLSHVKSLPHSNRHSSVKNEIANRIYITKKSPKQARDNPITGLPNNSSSISPLKRPLIRPYFN